ncbi:Uncharacterised protein [Halioglobus japonicus]|nr:Uncharacterised protein [Halioglobus japonicus]
MVMPWLNKRRIRAVPLIPQMEDALRVREHYSANAPVSFFEVWPEPDNYLYRYP